METSDDSKHFFFTSGHPFNAASRGSIEPVDFQICLFLALIFEKIIILVGIFDFLIALLANKICSQLNDIQIFSNVFQALDRAVDDAEQTIVLCGSLYLIGYFLKETFAMSPVNQIK